MKRRDSASLAFTPFVAQTGRTVLMVAAQGGASMETMQLLLDSGAKASINDYDEVAHFHFNITV
jgi:hypothetical protein